MRCCRSTASQSSCHTALEAAAEPSPGAGERHVPGFRCGDLSRLVPGFHCWDVSGVVLGFRCWDLSGGVAATIGMPKVFLMSGIKQSHPLPFVGWGGGGMDDGGCQRTTKLGFRQAGLGLRGFFRRQSKGFPPLCKFSGMWYMGREGGATALCALCAPLLYCSVYLS